MRNYLSISSQTGTMSSNSATTPSPSALTPSPETALSNRGPTPSAQVVDQTRTSIEEATKHYGAATHRVVTKRYAIK